MTTNARIERFKREVEGHSVPTVLFSRSAVKAIAKLTLALAAVGAIAGTVGMHDEPEAKHHRFIGVMTGGHSTASEGNVPDLAY
jgi:hypothetical protein